MRGICRVAPIFPGAKKVQTSIFDRNDSSKKVTQEERGLLEAGSSDSRIFVPKKIVAVPDVRHTRGGGGISCFTTTSASAVAVYSTETLALAAAAAQPSLPLSLSLCTHFSPTPPPCFLPVPSPHTYATLSPLSCLCTSHPSSIRRSAAGGEGRGEGRWAAAGAPSPGPQSYVRKAQKDMPPPPPFSHPAIMRGGGSAPIPPPCPSHAPI